MGFEEPKGMRSFLGSIFLMILFSFPAQAVVSMAFMDYRGNMILQSKDGDFFYSPTPEKGPRTLYQFQAAWKTKGSFVGIAFKDDATYDADIFIKLLYPKIGSEESYLQLRNLKDDIVDFHKVQGKALESLQVELPKIKELRFQDLRRPLHLLEDGAGAEYLRIPH